MIVISFFMYVTNREARCCKEEIPLSTTYAQTQLDEISPQWNFLWMIWRKGLAVCTSATVVFFVNIHHLPDGKEQFHFFSNTKKSVTFTKNSVHKDNWRQWMVVLLQCFRKKIITLGRAHTLSGTNTPNHIITQHSSSSRYADLLDAVCVCVCVGLQEKLLDHKKN